MFERIKSILIKEFKQLFRDPRMKMVLFIAPLIQLFIFGFAVSTDVKHVRTAVFDLDNTPQSRDLVREFSYSGYFNIKEYIYTEQQQDSLLDRSAVSVVIRINRGFARDLTGSKTAQFQLVVDGTDSNTSGVILDYASRIIERYSRLFQNARLEPVLTGLSMPSIDLRNRAWFNENLESRNFYIPGVIALLLLIITTLLTAVAIVKEKESGTIEQLMVSPIRPFELILGKLVPFALIGFFDILMITTVAVFTFKVPLRGNLFVLLASACLYLLTTLGIGLFISTNARTQQEAMMSNFFVIQPAVLLSGFVFPIANMPKIIQYITYINPLRYFIIIIRGIFLKGVGMDILWPQMLVLLIFGVTIISLSSMRFHKRY